VTTFLTFTVIGLSAGSAYAIAAMGLVLTFKTSGVFNFAHGAVAAASAGVFYDLRTVRGLPWPVALILTLGVAAPLLGIALERLARVLTKRSAAAQIAATVGLLIVLQGLLVIRFGAAPLEFPAFLPTNTVRIAGVFIGVDKLIVFALGLTLLAALTLFFRLSRLGLAMRAVVRDPELLDLTGSNPTSVRRLSWVFGISFAGLSGILIAPSVGLNGAVLTLLVVQAFGAAAIGTFSSLPLTYVGGLVVGVGTALLQRYTSDYQVLAGLPSSLPFIILFLVLALAPRSWIATLSLGAARSAGSPLRVPSGRGLVRQGAGFGVLLTLLLVVPSFAGARLPVYSQALIYIMVFLSFAVLIRLSGQVSLAVLSFAAIGGSTFSHFSNDAGIPWLFALLLAGLVAVPVGAVVAIPAIRLPGVYLAVASLGFAVLLQQLVYPTSLMFGSHDRIPTSRPAVWGFDSDVGYYYLLVTAVVLACAAVLAVQRGRIGRLLRAMADSPTALVTQGLDVNVTRLLVFCFSSFLAAIAGALSGPITGGVTGGVSSPFTALNCLPLLAIFFVSGRDLIFTSFIGALFFILPVYEQSEALTNYYPLVFGLLVMVIASRGSSRQLPTAGGQHLPAALVDRQGRGPARDRWQRRAPTATRPSTFPVLRPRRDVVENRGPS
jgi:branched-subunit amino acid ABC-type transport system permease component